MSVELPPVAAYRFDPEFSGTHVLLPRKRNWLALIFMTAWLGLWAVGEFNAYRQLSTQLGYQYQAMVDPASARQSTSYGSGADVESEWFLGFWLCVWTLGGAFALWALLSGLVGREEIFIAEGVLTYKGITNPLKQRRAYALENISNLRAQVPISSFWGARQRNSMSGFPAVKFDYGMSTIELACGMGEAEAAQLVEELKRRHPSLGAVPERVRF